MACLDQIGIDGVDYDLTDTKGRAMIAPKEASSTASMAHATGAYFTYNDLLYQATSDIAVGGTITPNTNCKAVTLSGDVSDLKSAIKKAMYVTEFDGSDYTWYQGSINTLGREASSDYAIRSDFIPVDDINSIVFTGATDVDGVACYALVCQYTGNTNNSFISGSRKDIYNNSAHTECSLDESCKYVRFVYGHNSSTQIVITPAEKTYFSADLVIVDAISELKSAITDYEINFATAKQIPALINGSGKYSPGIESGTERSTVQISAQGIAYLSIKANPGYQCEYAFLASTMEGLSEGDNIPFAEGETGKRTLQSGSEMVIKVPAGCNYITFLKTYSGNTYLPTYAVALKASSPAIKAGLGFEKCGVIGHSGPYGTRLSNRSDAWPYIAADILAIPNVNNVTVGGSTIAKQEDSYEEIYFSLADFEAAEKDTTKKYLVMDAPTDAHPFMLYRYANNAWGPEFAQHIAVNGARAPVVDVVRSLDADVDIIMIGAGANDYQYGWTPFGAVNDTPTKYTFCGAVHLLLQYIMATYPGVPVFFSDAIIWNQSLYTTANSIGKTYLDYLNAMKEIARMYKIQYVDFDAISSFPYPSDDATWYAEDEKHMSKKGHERVGQVVAAQIKSILG